MISLVVLLDKNREENLVLSSNFSSENDCIDLSHLEHGPFIFEALTLDLPGLVLLNSLNTFWLVSDKLPSNGVWEPYPAFYR